MDQGPKLEKKIVFLDYVYSGRKMNMETAQLIASACVRKYAPISTVIPMRGTGPVNAKIQGTDMRMRSMAKLYLLVLHPTNPCLGYVFYTNQSIKVCAVGDGEERLADETFCT